MKSIRHISRRLTWILIFTFGFIPIGSHASAGVLLCIESDGHVSVELAKGLRCASDLLSDKVLNEGEHSAEHLSEDQTHCVDCIDIIIKGATDADCSSFVSFNPAKAPSASVYIAPSFPPDYQNLAVLRTTDSALHKRSHDVLTELSTVVILN